MTYEEISEMMAEMGLPYTYHHFAEGEAPQLNNSPKALSGWRLINLREMR